MRAETRNRLWSAMLWTALAAALAGIVATASAFDASVLLPVMGAHGRLPAGYTECEYLESSGTQYIDTGLSIIGRRWTFDMAFLPDGGEAMGTIVIDDSGTRYRCHTIGLSNTGFMLGSAILRLLAENPKDRHTYAADATLGISIDSSPWEAPEGTLPNAEIWLFARNSVGLANIYVKARVYSSTFAEAGTGGAIVQNLVPALDESGVPCMFDLVTRAPFYNAGTGTFAYKVLE